MLGSSRFWVGRCCSSCGWNKSVRTCSPRLGASSRRRCSRFKSRSVRSRVRNRTWAATLLKYLFSLGARTDGDTGVVCAKKREEGGARMTGT